MMTEPLPEKGHDTLEGILIDGPVRQGSTCTEPGPTQEVQGNRANQRALLCHIGLGASCRTDWYGFPTVELQDGVLSRVARFSKDHVGNPGPAAPAWPLAVHRFDTADMVTPSEARVEKQTLVVELRSKGQDAAVSRLKTLVGHGRVRSLDWRSA